MTQRSPRSGLACRTTHAASYRARAIAAVTAAVLLLTASGGYMMVHDNDGAHAQSVVGHVVINEIDINPPGSDVGRAAEWVELYNPTTSAVDISGWHVASTTGPKKTLTVPEGVVMQPGQFVTYTYTQLWFPDINAVVELRDAAGGVIDSTPKITDKGDDMYSWQRIYDGYALSGSEDDWKFALSTLGSSNGQMQQQRGADGGEPPDVTISTDKEFYAFDQIATIRGTVSEIRSVVTPYFMTESVTLLIAGPGYQDTITLYPNSDLEFSTALDLKQVLGFGVGSYVVSAEYAGHTATASFEVVGHAQTAGPAEADREVSVTTAEASYTPGQQVTIHGATQDVVKFATFAFEVEDPDGRVVSSGNQAPVDGQFEISFLLDSVNPVYGTYAVTAEYAGRTATSTFEVVLPLGGTSKIALTSDKKAYALGQTAVISGMLNDVWTASLNVQVLQTRQSAIPDQSTGSLDRFKIERAVPVSGDGSFEYAFDIPDNVQRLGDYRITFSGGVGAAGIVVSVVDDPDSFIAVTEPLVIRTDRPSYVQNEQIVFTGYLRDVSIRSPTPEYSTSIVFIKITDESGAPLESMANKADIRRGFAENEGVIDYVLRAVLDDSGRYSAETPAYPRIFEEGVYTATATYRDLEASATFSVVNQYDITESAISTDKEVYGLGETVRLTGVLPPTGAAHVSVTLTKPDGSTVRSGAAVEMQQFSWEWNAPRVDREPSIIELRGPAASVFGVYKVTVSTDSESISLHFKLSSDPEGDSLVDNPLFVTTSKALYKPGDDLVVHGDVILHDRGGEDLMVPTRVMIVVKDGAFPFERIYESRVYPDGGGAFSSEFDLPIGVFRSGTYHVTASYGSASAGATFSMVNDYVVGAEGPAVLQVSTDRDEYSPGQTVTVAGGPNKVIFMGEYHVSVAKKTGEFEPDCVTVVCGRHMGPVTTIEPDQTASFTYQYAIPDGPEAPGIYEVTVESSLGTERMLFTVVADEEDGASTTTTTTTVATGEGGQVALSNQTSATGSQTDVVVGGSASAPSTADSTGEGGGGGETEFMPEVVIERRDRLPDSEFAIDARSTIMPTREGLNAPASPVSVTGVVITARGLEQSVDLQVTADDGACVIGRADSCMVRESTGKQGRAYEEISLEDGTNLRVVYSGADKWLERFAIYRGAGQEFLPDLTWNVSIIKDDQVSRFYYKVTYQTMAP